MTTVISGYMPTGKMTDISVGASPFTWVNPESVPVTVYISGTVSLMQVNRDGAGFIDCGLLGGNQPLNPGDSIKIAYIIAPSMKYYPS